MRERKCVCVCGEAACLGRQLLRLWHRRVTRDRQTGTNTHTQTCTDRDRPTYRPNDRPTDTGRGGVLLGGERTFHTVAGQRLRVCGTLATRPPGRRRRRHRAVGVVASRAGVGLHRSHCTQTQADTGRRTERGREKERDEDDGGDRGGGGSADGLSERRDMREEARRTSISTAKWYFCARGWQGYAPKHLTEAPNESPTTKKKVAGGCKHLLRRRRRRQGRQPHHAVRRHLDAVCLQKTATRVFVCLVQLCGYGYGRESVWFCARDCLVTHQSTGPCAEKRV